MKKHKETAFLYPTLVLPRKHMIASKKYLQHPVMDTIEMTTSIFLTVKIISTRLMPNLLLTKLKFNHLRSWLTGQRNGGGHDQ